MYDSIFLAPLRALGERVWRTYLGGKLLDERMGYIPSKDGHFPEEWIFSTVTARNPGREELEEGLCLIDTGAEKISIRDLIAKEPAAMLGWEHNRKYPGKLGVLVKLIDSQERLTIQAHPDKTNALRFFAAPFGKTECWHILALRPDSPTEPCLYMGFKEGITKEKWRECFDKQDIGQMLDLMHRIRVKPGETYLIQGGLPHAIGPGCLLMEIQEPTDYTLRVEKTTPSGFTIDEFLCHQGIGYDNMFECFDYHGTSNEEALTAFRVKPEWVDAGPGHRVMKTVGYNDTECFRMERVEVTLQMELTSSGRFSGLYVVSGTGRLSSENGAETLKPDGQFFVPAASRPFTISAAPNETLKLIRCYGPK